MKKYLIALVIVVLLIIIAGAIYLKLSNSLTTVPGPVACTMEAKLCPDGVTSVGRQGPNCEFAPCPVAQAVDEMANWKTYTNKNYHYTLKLPSSWSDVVLPEATENKEGCFSFHHQEGLPLCLLKIKAYTTDEWQKIWGSTSKQPEKFAETNGLIYTVDYSKDNNGGGQYSDYQRNRSAEIPQILSTFKFTK